jgi:hypothetical protein
VLFGLILTEVLSLISRLHWSFSAQINLVLRSKLAALENIQKLKFYDTKLSRIKSIFSLLCMFNSLIVI